MSEGTTVKVGSALSADWRLPLSTILLYHTHITLSTDKKAG